MWRPYTISRDHYNVYVPILLLTRYTHTEMHFRVLGCLEKVKIHHILGQHTNAMWTRTLSTRARTLQERQHTLYMTPATECHGRRAFFGGGVQQRWELELYHRINYLVTHAQTHAEQLRA